MQRYIIIRLVQSVFTLIGVSIIVFSLARLSGNPLDVLIPEEATQEDFERISKLWGLDEPWYIQYFTFVKNASKGEFGPSFKWQGFTAMELVMRHLPATLQLAVISIGVSVLLAVPIGVMSAVKKGTFLDTGGKLVALLGQSLPSFWLAIVLIWIFAVQLGWFPTSGRGGFSHMILPAVALGVVLRGVLHAPDPLLHAERPGQRVHQARAHQGPEGVEGRVEARPEERRHSAPHGVRRHRGGPDEPAPSPSRRCLRGPASACSRSRR